MSFNIRDIVKTGVISIILIVIIMVIGGTIISILIDENHPDANILEKSIIEILMMITVLLVINKYLLKDNGLGWDALGFTSLDRQQKVKLFLQIPLYWLLFMIVVSSIVYITVEIGGTDTSHLTETSDFAGLSELNGNLFLVLLSVAFLTPVLEEIIFRGIIMKALQTKFNTPIAILGSASLFMLVHQWSIVIMPGIFIMGVLYGYLYHKFTSIYAPIALHMLINGFNVIAVNVIYA